MYYCFDIGCLLLQTTVTLFAIATVSHSWASHCKNEPSVILFMALAHFCKLILNCFRKFDWFFNIVFRQISFLDILSLLWLLFKFSSLVCLEHSSWTPEKDTFSNCATLIGIFSPWQIKSHSAFCWFLPKTSNRWQCKWWCLTCSLLLK